MLIRTSGDVSLSAEDMTYLRSSRKPGEVTTELVEELVDHEGAWDEGEDDEEWEHEDEHVEHEQHRWLGGTTALKFLAAGGVAGAGTLVRCPLLSIIAYWCLGQYRERVQRLLTD
jgi:solute carrier family 25 phosphate transporter 23/24/25/41